MGAGWQSTLIQGLLCRGRLCPPARVVWCLVQGADCAPESSQIPFPSQHSASTHWAHCLNSVSASPTHAPQRAGTATCSLPWHQEAGATWGNVTALVCSWPQLGGHQPSRVPRAHLLAPGPAKAQELPRLSAGRGFNAMRSSAHAGVRAAPGR